MLYFYKSISPHNIEKLDGYLNNFFTNLFNEERNDASYDECICEDLRDLCGHYDGQIAQRLKSIFEVYQELDTDPKKNFVKEAFERNTNVQGVCNLEVDPVKYKELEQGTSKDFKNAIKYFYDSLWGENKTLGYVEVRKSTGTVKEHFTDFVDENPNAVCPFCGLNSLVCKSDDGRDDYDHYLHKSKYPFISVNFKNLFPMCHDCNSKRKGQKDAPFDENNHERRPLYYPYQQEGNHKIKISIDSPSVDIADIDSWHLNIECIPVSNNVKKESWKSIFNIEKRYKANLSDRSKWHRTVVFETYRSKSKKAHFDFEEFQEDLLREFKNDGMAEKAILWRTYRKFVLNQPDFEQLAQGKLT